MDQREKEALDRVLNLDEYGRNNKLAKSMLTIEEVESHLNGSGHLVKKTLNEGYSRDGVEGYRIWFFYLCSEESPKVDYVGFFVEEYPDGRANLLESEMCYVKAYAKFALEGMKSGAFTSPFPLPQGRGYGFFRGYDKINTDLKRKDLEASEVELG